MSDDVTALDLKSALNPARDANLPHLSCSRHAQPRITSRIGKGTARFMPRNVRPHYDPSSQDDLEGFNA
ncbi:hypothetical protein TrVFT333_004375 [Trichoderma virens FT-333]|nr:hypothetical protein TrVFT333_004375 [Trichoderma virens FT-333]